MRTIYANIDQLRFWHDHTSLHYWWNIIWMKLTIRLHNYLNHRSPYSIMELEGLELFYTLRDDIPSPIRSRSRSRSPIRSRSPPMRRHRNRWRHSPDGWLMKWHGSWWMPTRFTWSREHGWQPVHWHSVQYVDWSLNCRHHRAETNMYSCLNACNQTVTQIYIYIYLYIYIYK
jgi:hypothetical protein